MDNMQSLAKNIIDYSKTIYLFYSSYTSYGQFFEPCLFKTTSLHGSGQCLVTLKPFVNDIIVDICGQMFQTLSLTSYTIYNPFSGIHIIISLVEPSCVVPVCYKKLQFYQLSSLNNILCRDKGINSKLKYATNNTR